MNVATVLITIMASVSYQSAYATDIIAVQRFFYNQTADNGWGYGYQIMLVISTQMIGFCLGEFFSVNNVAATDDPLRRSLPKDARLALCYDLAVDLS